MMTVLYILGVWLLLGVSIVVAIVFVSWLEER